MIRLGAGKFFGETLSTRRFGPFAITASRYRAGELLPRHCHEQAYLYVMLAGGIAERALYRENLCTRGWLIYNEAGEAHQDQVLDQGALGLNIEMSAGWLVCLSETGSAREPVLYQHAGPAVTAVGTLQLAMSWHDCLQVLGVEEAVVRLIDSLQRPGQHRRRPPRWLGMAEELIRSRYFLGLCLDEIAEVAGVHPAHLCREFRRRFGCTMTQYAVRLRADRALQEVIRSDTPLATVAAQLGFADQAHLTRTIREHFGTTPGRLRRDRHRCGAIGRWRK
jgi:AraC family transcriptional regulator